jgi:hypothetical protein
MNLRPVAILLTLALAALAPLPASGDHHFAPDLTVPFNVSTTAREGVLVYHAVNPNGLVYNHDMFFKTTSASYNPFHIVAVNETGGIRIRSYNGDGSGGFVAEGDDAVYLGAGDTAVNNPPTRKVDWDQWQGGSRDFQSTEGWLVFVWKDQDGPWEFRSLWREGTVIELVATGTVDTLSHKNLKEGVRVGIPPALVNVKDGATLDTPGGQTFGWVKYSRSDYIGMGELAVTHEGTRHALDLTQYPTPEDTCYCGEEGRWYFTSHEPVQVDYDAVQFRGDGRLYVLTMHLPTGTLPDHIWQETILQRRNYSGSG